MAVINPSHRQAILKKAKSPPTDITASSDFNMDFDAIMGDLTSAIADLESIPVVHTVSLFFILPFICILLS